MVGLEGEFRGTQRFAVKRRIGAGGMGVVYEALDRHENTRVALKTLRHVSGQALYRLKRELRALQNVEHPNLVHLHELVEEAGQWFFTMELIQGVDFLSYVRPAVSAAPAQGAPSPSADTLRAQRVVDTMSAPDGRTPDEVANSVVISSWPTAGGGHRTIVTGAASRSRCRALEQDRRIGVGG